MRQHTTLSSFTDVLYVDWQVNASCGMNWDTPGEEIHGWETCLSLNSASACQQARVLIDTSSMDDPRTTLKKQRTLLCHETGHSLGLKHYFTTKSCMNDGLWSNNKKYYGGHMKSHLNEMY